MAHEERRTQSGQPLPPSHGGQSPPPPHGGLAGLEKSLGRIVPGIARLPAHEGQEEQYYVQVPVRPVSTNIPTEDLERMALYNIFYGALFLLIGVIAIVLVVSLSLPIQSVVAWLLFASGVVAALTFLLMLGAPGATGFLLLAVLHLGTGGWLVFMPQTGLVGLALVMSLWFFVHGILKLIMTCQVRHITTWPFVMISGITSIVLAVLVLILFPGKPASQLGIIFGVDLIVTAASLGLISCMAYFGKCARAQVRQPLLGTEYQQAQQGQTGMRGVQPPAGPGGPATGPGPRPAVNV